MSDISVFDIFKIGVGPSSSHTLGPWQAARRVIAEAPIDQIASITIHLYGSLSKTGKGHGTDIAIMLGLEGYDPRHIDTTKIRTKIAEIKEIRSIHLAGKKAIYFESKTHIIFHPIVHEAHPNTLRFEVLLENGKWINSTYCSIGGGFIEEWGAEINVMPEIPEEGSIESGRDLLALCDLDEIPISEVIKIRERGLRSEENINALLDDIWDTMAHCVHAGCTSEGILPGGLHVRRRAATMAQRLFKQPIDIDYRHWIKMIRAASFSFKDINNLVSCFALAVNEENADFGRVVTSPTNGAAGVIPAVIMYHLCFGHGEEQEDIRNFLLTAGQVGILFKKGATISAAVGGCQAEIGVSSAMAAAGLTAVNGGTPRQALMAAEIAMEHHLGLTCDPIGGLVQVPCIERNAMGAIKAITACHLALESDPEAAIVNFDTVIKALWETSKDMHHKYKETSEGGLAVQLPVILAEC